MNVLTAIDHLEKQFPGFRSEYERLCEYAHPGLAGGYGMYVRTEGEKLRSYFGQNPLGLEMDHWGRTELLCAMLANRMGSGLAFCLYSRQGKKQDLTPSFCNLTWRSTSLPGRCAIKPRSAG